MIASTLLTALFAATAYARQNVKRDDTCLTYDEAYQVASVWGGLIANYSSAVADEALVVNFTDYSESVNSLINNCPQGSAAVSLPLLDPTFTTRAGFELGQGQQPPIDFNLLQVFPGCGSVSFRWKTTNTAPIPSPRPIIGNIIIETAKNTNASTAAEYPFLITTVYSEFDSGDWLQNLKDAGICNITAPACTSSAPTTTATLTTSATPTTSATSVPDKVVSAPPSYITSAPTLKTSTSTDADGNVWVVVTEVDDVYVTETDVVTVTVY